jgi:hypothetical protein
MWKYKPGKIEDHDFEWIGNPRVNTSLLVNNE